MAMTLRPAATLRMMATRVMFEEDVSSTWGEGNEDEDGGDVERVEGKEPDEVMIDCELDIFLFMN